MRISFVVNGTRGDVQPALVLAHRLAVRGHEVRIGVPPNMIRACVEMADDQDRLDVVGLDVVGLGLDTREHLDSVARAREQAGRNPVRRLRALAALRDAGWDELVHDMADVVSGAHAIVTGLITEQPASAFAEAAGVPLISLHHAPVRRNRRVGPLPANLPGSSGAAVRAQWALVDALFWQMTRRRENRLRARLGLPRVSRSFAARMRATAGVELQAYDPIFGVHADPTWDGDARDRRRPVTGFIGLPAALRPQIDSAGTGATGPAVSRAGAGLSAWLDAGDPPIYVGFGSMPLRGRGATVEAVVTVARRLGRRVLICAGWNDLGPWIGGSAEADDAVRIETQVDHDTVFGRCAVVVHHGGAGTTAAALRAGTPSVICWYGADQPFWGEELRRLGVGSSMPMVRAGGALDVERLHDAVTAMLDPRVGSRARRLAHVLLDTDTAIGYAVREIEQQMTSSWAGESNEGGGELLTELKVDA